MSASEIAAENDRLRRSIPFVLPPHRFVMTPGVAGLSEDELFDLFHRVRTFNAFNTRENDPHGERDFGAVVVNSEKYFFKFDYYDGNFEFFEENGTRVLTLMRADEY